MKISVATPTYNRKDSLNRVFHSLMSQTFKDFEWIVIDDGSIDGTKQLIEQYQQNSDFPILYFYQENNGKHIAINRAVDFAKGEFFVIADSDDSFRANSFEILLKYWDDIPDNERNKFRGITCRCYDPDTDLPEGIGFPGKWIDLLGLDAVYKHHYYFEMWGMNRTDVMKEYPFLEIKGGKSGTGLSFYPESIVWNRMGRKYVVRFINEPLRAHYRDQENAVTRKKKNRSRENIYLWEHYINEIFDYFRYYPKLFLKAIVGLSMDSFLLGKSLKEIFMIPNTGMKKCLVTIFLPVGYLLYLQRRNW